MSTVIMRRRRRRIKASQSRFICIAQTTKQFNVLYTKHKATQGSIKSISIQKKKELNRKYKRDKTQSKSCSVRYQ